MKNDETLLFKSTARNYECNVLYILLLFSTKILEF